MEGTSNLTVLYVSWWYGEGYARIFKYIRAFYIYLTDLFSVKICLVTLFSPWKRDKISYEGLSLQQKLQVWTLNMSSRFIGFGVKIATIITYLVAILVVSIFSVLLIIVWPILPLLAVYIIYLGIVTILQ